ncbi:DUF2267 domain-containing protein [Aestuariivita sp.]|jgi:uncharacterized protein (DUF2267 family)|uniref:DUF2267 domain-containing protein n=1 Tax=Aestuariivita sp. TaxID=1872407 RepID=UPI00216E3D3E|nr:DUF2267 domain-containing protein [Aestuariivita sp.]MCE8005954.1 DUF2267 domain-containing protein [Aestuariivita sp.]
MSAQGLEVIDHTVQLTHEWINELAERLDWASRRSALRLLRISLHHVRDHLPVDELAQFSAQLPLLIRGMMFEGWKPKDTPVKDRKAWQFRTSISDAMAGAEEYRGERDIDHVFALLNARISRGEVEDIRACLPDEIRALWPAP